MSYCRFSSDQFRCDVYVFEHCGGWWQIYVAGNKLVSDTPRPEFTAGDWWARGEEGIAAYTACDTALCEWMEQAQRVAIELPHAGEGFELGSPGDCADTLVMLKELGYVVPQSAIDALREEAAEQ